MVFFLWKIVQYLVYLGQDEDFKQTMKSVRKSAISLQPGNHKPLKWIKIALMNKISFIFKIKFGLFQITKT